MNLMDLFVKISVDDQASSQVETIGSKLKGGLVTAAKVGAAAIGAVTAATGALYTGITAAAGSVASYGDNIDKMSQKMGMSAEAYQEWDAVMQHSGTSIESLQAGMKTLANAVESGNDAFERLGISQEEIAKMSNEELFSATITALQNVENETERTYLAGQLLGRGATELGALLNTSAEDTKAMKDRVHELGGVMSNEAVKAAARYQDSLQDMKTSFSGLKNSLIADFLPGMATVMDGIASLVTGEDGAQATISSGISQMLESMNSSLPRFLDAGKQIVESIFQAITQNLPQMVSGGIEMLMSIVDGIVNNIDEIVDSTIQVVDAVIDGLTNNLPKLIEGGIRLIAALANGLIRAIPDLVSKIPQIISSIVNGLISGIPAIFDVGKNIVEGLWNGIKNMGSWITGKVKGFFSGIVSGVKNFLGIHSPSRVFADMGKNMALGIGEGWDKQYDSIKKDIESGMNFTASVSSTGNVPSAIAQSPEQAQNYVLDALKNINFSIYLDGKTLVGKLAPTIDEQMGTLHIARARGV